MVAMDLEEQEQIAEIKAWWKRYGNVVCVIVLAVSVVVLGYRGWDFYQNHQAQQAVLPYEVLKKAIDEGDSNKIAAASDTLTKEYGSTTFATMGNMEAAKALYDKKDLAGAVRRYRWVAENGVTPEWQMMARLNLSAVLIDQKRYDEALKVLDVTPVVGFEARLLAAKGDVYWVADRLPEARKAYQDALTKLDVMPEGTISKEGFEQQNIMFKQLTELKLGAVGKPDDSQAKATPVQPAQASTK